MNDRFKFRVWDKERKTMNWSPELIQDEDGLEPGYFDASGCPKSGYRAGGYALMQSTGLKDKNDKLIYEGDVVVSLQENDYETIKLTGEVLWSSLSASFRRRLPDGRLFPFYEPNQQQYEIIGNIHENPELLEQTDE